ncbi:hypothetical protein PGH07_00950 [Sulfurovum sp. zt1-1]|uniref:Uncharacterized protein n=1 Tax=Sulfurovum zhangzhouensis TaxID=3019067 RepID=A0ABT7QVC1_9BACT|nr:hypothetical protein [Sulfurovum zhangzhouensis]MDM5270742.1 hypothetical protein [Sulfurovum zhangzhouensis]
MNNKIQEILNQIEELEGKLKAEIDAQEKHISYEIKEGYVKFEESVLKKQRENMKGLFRFFAEIPASHLLTSPFVYGMIIPAFLLDITLFFYQNVIFRLYGFKFVKRSEFIVFDRQYLRYLNFIEKLNCLYCSYFNGLMQYAADVAAKTELYFCPIKHAKKTLYRHRYYKDFLIYGDGEDYQKRLKLIRENIDKSASVNSKSNI